MSAQPTTASQRLRLLQAIIAFTVLSTAIHYGHNAVRVDEYPPNGLVGDGAFQVIAVVTWIALTAVGLLGYRLYSHGRTRQAAGALAVYSVTGLGTLGHFTQGPVDIPPLFFATLFTDALGGLAVLAFAVWAARNPRPQSRPGGAPDAIGP